MFWLEMLIKGSILALGIQGACAYVVLLERRTASWMQDRIGPNRCGPWGLLQPLADGIKLLFKEDVVPDHVNKPFFIIAPALSLLPALATLAVVPFGEDIVLKSGRVIEMQVADVDIGLLFVVALASLGVYGLALGGWASGSKYSLLGGVRSSAQMISYELSLTLSVLAVVMTTGSLRLNDIVMGQGAYPWQWNLFGHGLAAGGAWQLAAAVPLFVAGVIFLTSVFAETNRLPFDMPEAESELVSGYHTEYSSMKFGLFFLAEYANMITGCALVATLFLGGWMFPGWDSDTMQSLPVIRGAIMAGTLVAKIVLLLFVMMWVRWTIPRFRFDQLMELGWKRLLPAALACVVLAAGVRVAADYWGPDAHAAARADAVVLPGPHA
jgi:NADH-quinone oxidoreductase subunit H